VSFLIITNGMISDSLSNVPISHVDIHTTATRNFGVDYTNNTGRTIFLGITILHQIPTVSDNAYAAVVINGTVISRSGYEIGNSPGETMTTSQMAAVKPGQTYRCNSFVGGTGTNTLVAWIESW
jgi:hypothetical protein